MHTGPTPEDAQDCAVTFLRLTALAADDTAEQAGDALAEYLTTDDDTAHFHAWALASIGPLIAAHALRRLWTAQLHDDDLIVIEELPGAPSAVDDHGMAMLRAVVEHANQTEGRGIEYATDIVAAHYRSHGPEGMIKFIVELIKLSAFLWQQGAYEPAR